MNDDIIENYNNECYSDEVLEDEFEPVTKSNFYKIEVVDDANFNDHEDLVRVNNIIKYNENIEFTEKKIKGNFQQSKLKGMLIGKFISLLNQYIKTQGIKHFYHFKINHKLYKLYSTSNLNTKSKTNLIRTCTLSKNGYYLKEKANKEEKINSKSKLKIRNDINLVEKQDFDKISIKSNFSKISKSSLISKKPINKDISTTSINQAIKKVISNNNPKINKMLTHTPIETQKSKSKEKFIKNNHENLSNNKKTSIYKNYLGENREKMSSISMISKKEHKQDQENFNNYNFNKNNKAFPVEESITSIVKIKSEDHYNLKELELNTKVKKYIDNKYRPILSITIENFLITEKNRKAIMKYKEDLANFHYNHRIKNFLFKFIFKWKILSSKRTEKIITKIENKSNFKLEILGFFNLKKFYTDQKMKYLNAKEISFIKLKIKYGNLLFKGLKIYIDEKEDQCEKEKIKKKLENLAFSLLQNDCNLK